MVPLGIIAIYLAVSVLAYLLAVGFRLSAWLLCGLHTFLLPGDSAAAAAAEEEEFSSQDCSDGVATDRRSGRARDRARARAKVRVESREGKLFPRQNRKQKEKDSVVWNDSGSQILRICIGDSHLENRKHYPEFDEAVIYSTLAMATLFTSELLNSDTAKDTENQASLSIYHGLIPLIVCMVSVYKLIRLLALVTWEKNLSRNLDWFLGCASGVLGFLLASIILSKLSALDEAIIHANEAERLYLEKKGADHVAISIPGFVFAMRMVVAMVAGAVSAVFLGSALRSVRCFWLGTDQLGWNLSITNRGLPIRALLNLNMVLPLLTSLLWIRPLTQGFVQTNPQKFAYESVAFHRYVRSLSSSSDASTSGSELVLENPIMHSFAQNQDCGSPSRCTEKEQAFRDSHNFEGIISESSFPKAEKVQSQDTIPNSNNIKIETSEASHSSDFAQGRRATSFYINQKRVKIRRISLNSFEIVKFCAMLLVVLFQLGLFRVNMQTYFNGGVLVWYQSLHQSRAYDIELTKAKVLVTNYFMCRVALQFLAPGMLIILFSGMARSCESCIDFFITNGDYYFSALLITREMMLFLTWWTVSVWAVLTCAILALFRLGLFRAS